MNLPITSGPFPCPGLLQYKDGTEPGSPPFGNQDIDASRVPPERTSAAGTLSSGQTIASFYWVLGETAIGTVIDISPPLVGYNGTVIIDYAPAGILVPINIDFTIYDSNTLTERIENFDFGASATSQSITVGAEETVTACARQVRAF